MERRWIETSFTMGFGEEDGGEDIAVRFWGYYGAAYGPVCNSYGDVIDPGSAATFEHMQVRWSPDGERWEEFPVELLTQRLIKQLERIGIADHEGRADRGRDHQLAAE